MIFPDEISKLDFSYSKRYETESYNNPYSTDNDNSQVYNSKYLQKRDYSDKMIASEIKKVEEEMSQTE